MNDWNDLKSILLLSSFGILLYLYPLHLVSAPTLLCCRCDDDQLLETGRVLYKDLREGTSATKAENILLLGVTRPASIFPLTCQCSFHENFGSHASKILVRYVLLYFIIK